jgi:HK97 family phage portal protein
MVNPFTWIMNKVRAVPQQPSALAMTRGYMNPGGIPVTLGVALRLSTFWALSTRIGKILATLPVKVLRLEGDKRIPAIPQTEAMSWIWDYSPNKVWNGPKFKEALGITAVATGNAYAMIIRDGNRRPAELEILNQGTMTPQYLDSGRGQFVYQYIDALGREFNYDPRDIIHIAGPSRGLLGDSLVEIAANTISEAKAITDYAQAWYQSAGNLGGVITAAKVIAADKRKEYEKAFTASWGGSSNAGGVVMLDNGMTFTPLGAKISEANVSSLREDILLEAARVFDLPIPLIQYKAGAQGYGSNIETLIDGFMKFSLGRWTALIGAELTVKCFPRYAGPTYVVEVDTSALRRGTLLNQSTAYANLVNARVASRNECRTMAGWNTVDEPGMDDYIESSAPDFEVTEAPPEKEEQIPTSEETDDSED